MFERKPLFGRLVRGAYAHKVAHMQIFLQRRRGVTFRATTKYL